MPLKDAKIATRLPTQNLERARAWYSEKLGLQPSEAREGGLLYKVGDSEFALYASAGTPDGSFTQMAFTVSDVAAEAAELRARGVVLESYTSLDFRTHDGIAEISGNYPSKGDGERACWFRDSEGNMLGMGQATRKRGRP